MKLEIEIKSDGIFAYSYDIGEHSRGSGTQSISSHTIGLFVDVMRELEKVFTQQDKWSTQLEAIRRLVEKEKEEIKP